MTPDLDLLRSITHFHTAPSADSVDVPWEGGAYVCGVSVDIVYQGRPVRISLDHVELGGSGHYGFNGEDGAEIVERLPLGSPAAEVRPWMSELAYGEKLWLVGPQGQTNQISVIDGRWPAIAFDPPAYIHEWAKGESGSPLFDSDGRLAGMFARYNTRARIAEAVHALLILTDLREGAGG